MAQVRRRPSKEVLDTLYHQVGLTQREIAARFNVSKTTVSKWAAFYGIVPRQIGRKRVRVDPALLQAAVSKSMSVRAVVHSLGLPETGPSHRRVTQLIRDLSIDIGHFLGQRTNSGAQHKGGAPFKDALAVLIKRDAGGRTKHSLLRRSLLELGRPYRCRRCAGLSWLGKNLVLEVHHSNGDWLDNRPENLEFLCPNCHSLTSTYRSKNAGRLG